jgi:hypothetical protein
MQHEAPQQCMEQVAGSSMDAWQRPHVQMLFTAVPVVSFTHFL